VPGTPVHIHRLARQIMTELDAFEGSKPLLDDVDVLIVRGVSRSEDWDLEDLTGYLEQVLEKCGVEVLDPESEEGRRFIETMGQVVAERIQAQYSEEEPVPVRPIEEPGQMVDAAARGEIIIDPLGFERVRRDLEAMGCAVGYVFGRSPEDLGVFLAAWADRSGVGPKSVELVVANLKGVERVEGEAEGGD